MAKASASAVQAGYIIESTWGTTPSAAVKYFRATSSSIKAVKSTVSSEELRPDGQVTDMVRVGGSGTASFGFELSYGNLDDFLMAAFRASAWTADTGLAGSAVGTDLLENGTTLKSFTLESYFSDIGQYATLTGARVNQITLNIPAENRITGTVEFLGKVVAIGSSSLGTGTATAAPTAPVMSAVDISSFTEGGSEQEFMGLDLTIANDARLQPVVGTAATSLGGIGYGRFVVTGTLKTYFTDAALISKFLNHTASSQALTIGDSAGNEIVISLPKLYYTDSTFDASGNDQDVSVESPFQAILDPTTGKTIRAERTAA